MISQSTVLARSGVFGPQSAVRADVNWKLAPAAPRLCVGETVQDFAEI